MNPRSTLRLIRSFTYFFPNIPISPIWVLCLSRGTSSFGQFLKHLELVLLLCRPLGPYARQHLAGIFGKPLADLSRGAPRLCCLLLRDHDGGLCLWCCGRPASPGNGVLGQVNPLGGDKVGLR
jgi:hypothetical protein